MDKKEIRHTLLIVIPIFSLCIAYILLFGYRTVEANDNPDQQTIYYSDYYITGYRGTRRGFDEVDGTNEYFYVLVGNKVDAYDHQGNYDHTLVFTVQRENGGTSIVCSSDTLYVSTKDNTIHAFRGKEYLGTVTREEIEHLPAFYITEGRVFAAKDGVYKAADDGTAEYICPLPETLEKAMPVIPVTAQMERNLGLVFIAVFFVFWFGNIAYLRWKRR